MFDEKYVKSLIRDIPDYPKKGIMFRDITTLIGDPAGLSMCIDRLAELAPEGADYVVGIEARGFIFGAALAYKLGKGFIPIRKKGKLPYNTVAKDYGLEYGTDRVEMHSDALENGSNVVIVDDLLATGGTAKAAAELVADLGGTVSAMEFVVELGGLQGRTSLPRQNVISLVKY